MISRKGTAMFEKSRKYMPPKRVASDYDVKIALADEMRKKAWRTKLCEVMQK
jgi:hypothetical protein